MTSSIVHCGTEPSDDAGPQEQFLERGFITAIAICARKICLTPRFFFFLCGALGFAAFYTTLFCQFGSNQIPAKPVTSAVSKVKSPFTSTVSKIQQMVNTSPGKESRDLHFHPVTRGTNVQVGELQVHITTAVYYSNLPNRNTFNVFLNGWARHNTSMGFKCCLMQSLSKNGSGILEVPARVYHIYAQWIVDMQNAEFSCSVSQTQLKKIGHDQKFHYVTFATKTCQDVPNEVLKIEYPQQVNNSVGICLKISYGDINPENVIEYLEYSRAVGVTRVFTFLAADLNPTARRVFLHYNKTGFVDANVIHPAKPKHGPSRGFRHPRNDHQAWVDEVMAANDCKHRMSGLDYVIVADLDEFIVPQKPTDSIVSILQASSKQFPKAAAFRFDSHVVVLNWNETRETPLHIMTRVVRTTFDNYDGASRNSRWAFMPHRIYFAQNNAAWPQTGYAQNVVPHELYTLLHQRVCKSHWEGCLTTLKRVKDTSILRYERGIIERMRKLPLDTLLSSGSRNYVKNIQSWNMSALKLE